MIFYFRSGKKQFGVVIWLYDAEQPLLVFIPWDGWLILDVGAACIVGQLGVIAGCKYVVFWDSCWELGCAGLFDEDSDIKTSFEAYIFR